MDATLLKGLRVLETLAQSQKPRGVTELAHELGLPKSNLHRTLQTLVGAGYARPAGEAGAYECSLKLFELGSLVVGGIDIRSKAEPVMLELVEHTRETVHLSVLEEMEVIYLHKIESPEPVRAYSMIGGRAPAHCVASGKALLAHQSAAWLARMPDPLPGFSTASKTSADAVRTELAQVRARGYAVNHGEWREAVGGLAAVVFGAHGRPVASLGISGPLVRIEPGLQKHVPSVIHAARETSQLLGCVNYDDLAASGEG